MTKDILVKISGMQFTADNEDPNEPEPVEIIAPGEYYFKNGKHYIIYDEFMEGFDSVTKNVLKLKNDSLEITKRGSSNVHMIFEKDKKNLTCYTTPFGNLMMGIDARRILIEESEEEIYAQVEYALDINYEHLADCTIQLRVQPKRQQ
ncbi:MAG: DUF1934 domain-containing protein [Eubacterium sp.]|jgi:Uncharacterized protein conserved in bacteria|nr:DUF1934 domain-containing protein [Eubacterium sp.]